MFDVFQEADDRAEEEREQGPAEESGEGVTVVCDGVFEEGGRIMGHEAFLGEADGEDHPWASEDEDRQGGGPPTEACEVLPAAIHDER